MRAHFISLVVIAAIAGLSVAGCPSQGTPTRNPFLTATEAFGAGTSVTDEDQGSGSGAQVEQIFRQMTTLTLANNHRQAELNTSFVAWVSPSSIRSGEQQDALLESGYVQLNTQVVVGTALTLVSGTYVYNGPGTAGATTVALAPTRQENATADTTLAVTQEFELLTPDGILIFSQPPVSCDSVAFFYTIDGDPLTSEGVSGVGDVFAGANTALGGLKTLSQVDAYTCDPFEPGLFLKVGGGAVQPNEYFEGTAIRVDFYEFPNAAGYFAEVTKTEP